MAFADIAKRLEYPRGLSQRYKTADALDRFMHGRFYDDAKLYPFEQEYTGWTTGEYIPLRERRPNVVSNFAREFVEQCAGLLFGDEQFPTIRVVNKATGEPDHDAELKIQKLIEQCELDDVLLRTTLTTAIGSSALLVRVRKNGLPFVETFKGFQCLPIFADDDPLELIGLVRIYPVKGETLQQAGYEIKKDDLEKTFWLRIDIDASQETRYKPLVQERFERIGQDDPDKHGEKIRWIVDDDRTYDHGFPLAPVVWSRAPLAEQATDIDGPCIWEPAKDTLIEIDYQLSQIGRGYKYTADPMLAIKRGELSINSYDPSGSRTNVGTNENGEIEKGANKVIEIPAGGDAKLLEISGQGLTAALNYVTRLREYALECIGGMKSDSETQRGAQSGKALELLFQSLVLVIKRLRIAMGNNTLVPLIDLLLRGIAAGELSVPGVEGIDPDAIQMRLVWPSWISPTGADLQATAEAWQMLAGGSANHPVPILPRDSITRVAASNLGFSDPQTIVDDLDDQVEEDQKLAQQQAEQQAALDAKVATAGKQQAPSAGE